MWISFIWHEQIKNIPFAKSNGTDIINKDANHANEHGSDKNGREVDNPIFDFHIEDVYGDNDFTKDCDGCIFYTNYYAFCIGTSYHQYTKGCIESNWDLLIFQYESGEQCKGRGVTEQNNHYFNNKVKDIENKNK